jgi:hypothetical protein
MLQRCFTGGKTCFINFFYIKKHRCVDWIIHGYIKFSASEHFVALHLELLSSPWSLRVRLRTTFFPCKARPCRAKDLSAPRRKSYQESTNHMVFGWSSHNISPA